MKKETPPFLFLHIPKTGGITFHAIIRKQYLHAKRFSIIIKKDVFTWNALSREEKLKYGVVKGHFWWQGVEFHPAGGVYFTFLRNAEQRLISHYHYVHERKQGKVKKVFGTDPFSLKQLLQSGKFLNFDNCMVRYLSGNVNKEWDKVDESDLKLAIKNFDEHFKHFGLLEKYDESLVLLSYELGWKTPYYIRLNEGKKNDSVAFDPETKELIQHFSRHDTVLWEYAQKKFAEKKLPYQEKLSKDLEDFRNQNKKNIFFRKLYYILFGQKTIR